MSTRREVVDALGRIAFAMDVLGDAGSRAYSQAAWTLRSAEGDFDALAENGGLSKLPGVGKRVMSVVRDIVAGQTPEVLVELEAQLPKGLFQIRRVKGLGGKKVRALYETLHIESLGELEYACRENRLIELKGFGKKTQAKVLEQIAAIRETEGWLRRDQAARILRAARAITDSLEVGRVAIVGAYARGAELVRQVELLVGGSEADEASLRLSQTENLVVHVADESFFGAAQVRLTGSAEHIAALETHANEMGAELEGFDEDEVYERLGLLKTPAERREAGVPLTLRGQERPKLVRRDDLRGALHNHTTASDGTASLQVMREAARERGLQYLGISEHSQFAAYARGLSEDALIAQAQEIAALNDGTNSCTLLSGVESDILQDGALDYPPEILAQLSLVIASVHRRFSQGPEAMTERMLAAASNPFTDVIGHPTGRLLLSRPESGVDMQALVMACATRGAALELNCNPQRLDLSVTHLAMAKEAGVLVAVSADAHAPAELDNLDHGIALARRAGLCAEDVLNAKPLDALLAWTQARRAKASGTTA